jgi:hypothetical protein
MTKNNYCVTLIRFKKWINMLLNTWVHTWFYVVEHLSSHPVLCCWTPGFTPSFMLLNTWVHTQLWVVEHMGSHPALWCWTPGFTPSFDVVEHLNLGMNPGVQQHNLGMNPGVQQHQSWGWTQVFNNIKLGVNPGVKQHQSWVWTQVFNNIKLGVPCCSSF